MVGRSRVNSGHTIPEEGEGNMNNIIVEFDKLLERMNSIDHADAVKKAKADLISVQTKGSA